MSEPRLKSCPECRTLAALDATSCAGCGHRYRTQFTPEPNLSPPPVPLVAPPPFHPPADPVARVSDDRPDFRSASSSLDSGSSYATARRRLPLLGLLAAVVVLFRVFHIATSLGCAPHWHR